MFTHKYRWLNIENKRKKDNTEAFSFEIKSLLKFVI